MRARLGVFRAVPTVSAPAPTRSAAAGTELRASVIVAPVPGASTLMRQVTNASASVEVAHAAKGAAAGSAAGQAAASVRAV